VQEVTHEDGKVVRSLFFGKDEEDLNEQLMAAHKKALEDPTVVEIKQKKLDEKVVLYPDPVLRTKCQEATMSGSVLKNIIESMFKTMKEFGGVGLSAPQVGMTDRYFVVNITGKDEDALVFVNPAIDDLRGWQEGEEGCLSFPGVTVVSRRAKSCHIKAYDLEGKLFEMDAKGLLARVILHEYDHIEGKDITDRMTAIDRIKNKKALDALKAYHSRKLEAEKEQVGS